MQFIVLTIAAMTAVASAASGFEKRSCVASKFYSNLRMDITFANTDTLKTTMLPAPRAVTPAAMAGNVSAPLSGTPVFAFPTTKACSFLL